MTLDSAQPLTEISTRNLSGGIWRPARKGDNLIANCLENVGASTSHNPTGFHGLLQESLALPYDYISYVYFGAIVWPFFFFFFFFFFLFF
jgi:hypothetical protein